MRIPNVGTLYSQRGNVTFPTWEYYVPSMGIIVSLCSLTILVDYLEPPGFSGNLVET